MLNYFYSKVFRCATFLSLDIEQLKQLIDNDELYTVEEENVCIKVILFNSYMVYNSINKFYINRYIMLLYYG